MKPIIRNRPTPTKGVILEVESLFEVIDPDNRCPLLAWYYVLERELWLNCSLNVVRTTECWPSILAYVRYIEYRMRQENLRFVDFLGSNLTTLFQDEEVILFIRRPNAALVTRL